MSGETDPSRSRATFSGAGSVARSGDGHHLTSCGRKKTRFPTTTIAEEKIPAEIARFETALLLTRAQILDMQAKIADAIGAKDASIFDAHLLVVEDRTLIDEVLRTLEREHRNIESIFQQVANRYAQLLEQMDDPYLRERALDIHDVTRRVMMNLVGKPSVTSRTSVIRTS